MNPNLDLKLEDKATKLTSMNPLLNQKRYQNRRLIPIGLLHASIIFSLRR